MNPFQTLYLDHVTQDASVIKYQIIYACISIDIPKRYHREIDILIII